MSNELAERFDKWMEDGFKLNQGFLYKSWTLMKNICGLSRNLECCCEKNWKKVEKLIKYLMKWYWDSEVNMDVCYIGWRI